MMTTTTTTNEEEPAMVPELNYPTNLVGHDDDYVCVLPSDYQPDILKPGYNPVWVKLPMKCLVYVSDAGCSIGPSDMHLRYPSCPLEWAGESLIDGHWQQEVDLHDDITFPLQPVPRITSKALEAVVFAETCTSMDEFYNRYKNCTGSLGDMFTCADFLGFAKTQYLIGRIFQHRLTRSSAGAKRPNHKTGRKGNIRYEIECMLQSDKTNDEVLDDIVGFFKKLMGYRGQNNKSLLAGRKRSVSEMLLVVDDQVRVVSTPSRPLANFTLDMLYEFEFIPMHAIKCMFKKIDNDYKRAERMPIKWAISKRYEKERREWEEEQDVVVGLELLEEMDVVIPM